MGRPSVLLVALLAALGAASFAGCSQESRYRVLAVLVDEPPKPGAPPAAKPVVRRARHTPPRKPSAPPPTDVDEETPPALPSVQEVFRQLPKDTAGGVDWVKALDEKGIEPAAGLDPAAKPQPVFPIDVVLEPEGQALFKVTFPHKPHTELLTCTTCHPGIFQMKAGADPITMAKIYAGEFCGRCHGKVAFAVPTGCPRCHRALAPPKPPAAAAPPAATAR